MQTPSEQDPNTRGGERVLILSAGVGSGHNSAAAAVRQACSERTDVAEVQVLDVLQASSALYRDVLGKGYFVLVEEMPWLVELGYNISDPPFRHRGPMNPWTQANSLPIVAAIKRLRPTVIVCTHFLPGQLVASLLLRGVVDARTAVVTTDYDFQGLWLSGAFHALFVAREEGKVELTALGLPSDRINATGIPITTRPNDSIAPAANGVPLLLVSAGAAGGDYALAVVRQLMHLRSPFRATVVCGRNDEMRQRMEQLVTPAADRFEVVGFITDMPELLHRADLFIGKPGGLSASECMAAGLPMVLVSPIPGQEVRNGDYLIEQGAAVRCNTTTTIGWKIDEILREPGRLARMQAAATKTGRPDAARDVMTALLDGSSRPLIVSKAAQKTVLDVSERHIVASDLMGPASLVRLIDSAAGSTVALLRADEVAELEKHYGTSSGVLVLRRNIAPVSLRSETRRLLHAILRGDDALPVRVEALTAPTPVLPR
ncbi:polysaccharide biosynthesis protein [Frondihabitans sp. PAMC 28766]|uniref:MGDG synthase family glycosyltransferase n=1 Tax=Frondihabitans sp. PAMC 28766 TaxID=1795630 RepID=UPI00078ED850|nr:glycosyltransferase [Frondihabitans sp. PAMC 28766]AMM19458.1 polysaccharide biosynthesis protein [Frondihabitans sp. PAMC 28766]